MKGTATADASESMEKTKGSAALLVGGAYAREFGEIVKFFVTGRRSEQRSRFDLLKFLVSKAKKRG